MNKVKELKFSFWSHCSCAVSTWGGTHVTSDAALHITSSSFQRWTSPWYAPFTPDCCAAALACYARQHVCATAALQLDCADVHMAEPCMHLNFLESGTLPPQILIMLCVQLVWTFCFYSCYLECAATKHAYNRTGG